MILKTLYYLVFGYLVLCTALFFFQRKLIYLPDTYRMSKVEANQQGLQYWPSYENFLGFTHSLTLTKSVGTVIIFHGNAGAAYHRRYYFDALTGLGYRVILAEYPGFGGKPGGLSETELVRDALKTIQQADQAFDGPLYLWGESLGSGVVASAIKKTEVKVDGLILFTPWDSLSDVAQTHYPLLPVRWLIKDKYRSHLNLTGYGGKVAVLLAGNDKIIPVRHGRNLFNAITTSKKLWLFESATHNGMPLQPGLSWWTEVMAFLSEPVESE